LPASDRALRAGLQLPASAPGDRRGGARGPLLPGGAAGASGHRAGSGPQCAGPGPGAAPAQALLPGGAARGAGPLHRALGIGAPGEAGRGGRDDSAGKGGGR
jgi:hypothetical protein